MADTKLVGDISEQAVLLECLKRGLPVLKPIGDRLPYDLALDLPCGLVKIQVKAAWTCPTTKNRYYVDVVQHRTNRKHYKKIRYSVGDFDFLVAHIQLTDTFFIIPFDVYHRSTSRLTLSTGLEKPQINRLKLQGYKDAWYLLDRRNGEKESR